ncbi:hypothetical protein B2J93_8572 [Marssonina coronariae]|uniref:Uncharacterized protein n=1 Tax=Diplocarpon coronariae TaxID=2795749 RepID=A0A218YXC9_9HELO|nr:hypothetical protein B2J93_8572 [Marssonina coronariae]
MHTSTEDPKHKIKLPNSKDESLPVLSPSAPASSPTTMTELSTESASDNESSSGSDISAWRESNPPEQEYFAGPFRRVASLSRIPSPSPGIDGVAEHQRRGPSRTIRLIKQRIHRPLGLGYRPARSSGLASELSQDDSDLEENGHTSKSKRLPRRSVARTGQVGTDTGNEGSRAKPSRAARKPVGETESAKSAGEMNVKRK